MAAFASSDVTVTVDRANIKIYGGQKCVIGTIAFGDGALTYPTGGIPLPAIGAFGFVRNLDALTIFGLNGLTTDYMLKYDKTNHKLQLFEEESVAAGGPLLECDTSEAPAARIYDFEAKGW